MFCHYLLSRVRNFMTVADLKNQIQRKLLNWKLLPEKPTQIKSNIMEFLQKTPTVCVTTDIWSYRQLKNFFGVPAHFGH